LVLIPPTVEWWRRRPGLDPLRWAAASIADDVAYGVGVWTGCLRSRSFGPLIPSAEFREAA
jgi:mycofactocin glycosyltransferase